MNHSKNKYELGGLLLSALPSIVNMGASLFQKKTSGIESIKSTTPYSNTQFGLGGNPNNNQFIYSKSLGYADELKSALSKMALPKGVIVEYTGDKHTDASGGIQIDDMGNALKNGKTNNTGFNNIGTGNKKVEDGEVTIDFNKLQLTDKITQNTVQSIAAMIAIKNQKHKEALTKNETQTEFGDGGNILGTSNLPDDKLLMQTMLALNSIKPVDVNTFNANNLIPDGINKVNVPNQPVSPSVNLSANDSAGSGGLSTGEYVGLAGQAVPALYNLAKGIFGRPAPAKENEFNNSMLQRAYSMSTDNQAQQNQANLAMNAGKQSIEENTSGGVRLAALAGLHAGNVLNKQQLALQNSMVLNQLKAGVNQTEAMVGQDRLRKFQQDEANKQSKNNQLAMGIQQLGQLGTNVGNLITNNQENSINLQALNSITDFEVVPEELKKSILKLIFKG